MLINVLIFRDKDLHLILNITFLLMLREKKVKERVRRTTQIKDRNIQEAYLRRNQEEKMQRKEYVKFKMK